MQKIDVSIVIPTFNRAEKLTKAIESSLNQSYPCEVIVVDHGSTDNTPLLMERYCERVKYIRREDDLGPHFCWLDGVLHAKGEYVHLQYDDDWIHQDFIKECINLFSDDVGMVFSDVSVIDLKTNHNDDLIFLEESGLRTGVYDNKILEKLLIKSGYKLISPGACLFRKNDVVDALYQGQIPIFNKNSYHGVGPDLFISLITLLRYKKFGYVRDKLAFFGQHEGSITIAAFNSEKSHNKALFLKNAYRDVRIFYLALSSSKKYYKKYEAIVDSYKKIPLKRRLKKALKRRSKVFKRRSL